MGEGGPGHEGEGDYGSQSGHDRANCGDLTNRLFQLRPPRGVFDGPVRDMHNAGDGDLNQNCPGAAARASYFFRNARLGAYGVEAGPGLGLTDSTTGGL